MSLDAVKILEISVTKSSRKNILEYVEKYLEKSPIIRTSGGKKTAEPLRIVTPNPEQIMLARSLPEFARILNRADIAIPDGIGVVWASGRRGGQALSERITGVDLMQEIVDICQKQGVAIGLIGGRGGLAFKAFKCLSASRPQLAGWAIDGPEIGLTAEGMRILNQDERVYFDMLLDRIRVARIRVLFIGLGAPKQEYFMERLSRELQQQGLGDGRVLMVVGGALAMVAGQIRRAPGPLRSLGLEWLWRLLLEPWRIVRQLALIRFVLATW